MRMQESDIVYENPSHWVLHVGIGFYKVFRIGITHSEKVATIHFSNNPAYALDRAIKEADRRHLKLQCKNV